MIHGRSVLAVIPARGGSKGVPRKNVREVAGKPLIAWSIEEAKKSKYIDRLILSSDDAEIMAVAKAFGCDVPFVRPAELARDETPGIEPVLHAAGCLPDYEIVVLLQPTSPLRIAADIDACIEKCVENGSAPCVSVSEVEESPYWMFTLEADGKMRPLIATDQVVARRQDLPQAFILNGAVYVATRDWLLEHRTFLANATLAYVMPRERALDIDTELDLKFLASFLSK